MAALCIVFASGFLSGAGPIQLSVLNTTQGPSRSQPAFLTLIGRNEAGQPCRLTPHGQFLPCTRADNQVEKAGLLWCDYGLALQADTRLELDPALRIHGGRIYLSVGAAVHLRVDPDSGALVEPNPDNPADPNAELLYDWVEFALDGTGFHGNTTCVDQFSLPITLLVRGADRDLGPVGIRASRAELFQAWRLEVPTAFQDLAEPSGRRILAPTRGPGYREGARKDHFQERVADLWRRHAAIPLVLTPDEGTFTGLVDADGRLVFKRAGDPAQYLIQGPPSSTEIFLCNGVLARGSGLEKVLGAQLAALLNRNVADPLRWRDPAQYYQAEPCNPYARFWHQHSLGGLAYGFPYDDVNDQSPSLACAEPREIQIAFRWD